jgi:hypothetical protein
MRIDKAYHLMHYKVQKLARQCNDMQATCFQNASIFAFIMLSIGLPLTLIISIDFKKRLRPEIILAPTTAAWVGFLVA